jgi:predicted  nucleic acid-binding Zn-ribbon protein
MTLIAYGTAINTALRNPRTKLEDLKALRGHAQSLMKAQGDLKGALSKLEKEIKAREKGVKSAAKKKKK